jgi:hypothetical protein
VCFFSSPQEEYATILPFVLDGLLRGERAYHVLRSRYREKHLEELRNAGIDVASAQQRRQLEVTIAEETYLRGGTFNEDNMLDLIQETLKSGAALGFPLTRHGCPCGGGGDEEGLVQRGSVPSRAMRGCRPGFIQYS